MLGTNTEAKKGWAKIVHKGNFFVNLPVWYIINMNFSWSNQMSEKRIERKIAVIFAADVVGYSKHMKNNEDNTLKSFKACKKF